MRTATPLPVTPSQSIPTLSQSICLQRLVPSFERQQADPETLAHRAQRPKTE
jgi:hypothetical protein